MPRCRSWRATPQDGHTGHLPGDRCRRCWSPCRGRVERGTKRCEACLSALVTHPEERVRLALTREQGVPSHALLLLVDDAHARVSAAARLHLAERGHLIEGTD